MSQQTQKLQAEGQVVSSANALPTYDAGAPSGVTLTTATLADASKTVAATGTPEALGSGTVREVFIYPLRTNTGDVYWGTTSTNDTQHGTLPVVLTAPPGKVIDLAAIYLDVTVNGEGVRYITNN